MAKLYLREHAVADKGTYPLAVGGVKTKAYSVWFSMLDRCYSTQLNQVTYEECEVCQDWFYFQKFAKWFYVNYKAGFHLDKDILNKGSKIYSPENCVFVPQEINNLLTDSRNSRGEYPQGVSRITTPTPSYQAKLSKSGKPQYLGSFKSIEKAYDAYKKAKEVYVKEVALKHLELGNINLSTFKALQKWEL